ncbi:MAG: segregation/condensation protein A [Clostridiales bacterium]|nr:segregation/condensation protein A [Clostridiales bacterium]
MSYQVVLPIFEGPLDLLLNLIDVHELDIYDIPIAFITGQYMDYLRKAEEIDLNLSGEFLVMAGTLLVIKAKMLLPQRAPEEESDDNAEDPRDELVEKLLAYRLYKENAQELQKMESSRTKIYFREVNEGHLFSLFPQPNPVGSLKAEDLCRSFQEVMRLMSARGQVITVRRDVMSVNSKMAYLMQNLSRQPGGIRFMQLFDACADTMEAVTTFLALLELLSKGLVWVRQKKLFGDIFVSAIHAPEKEGAGI